MTDVFNNDDIKTFTRRYGAFRKTEARTEHEAYELSESLYRRDRDGDDRRICPECRNWRNRKCARGHRPLPYLLQRHDCMQLRGSQPQVSAGR